MNLYEEVRPGSNRYINGLDLNKELLDYLDEFNNVVIVTGDVSYKIFNDYYKGHLDYPVYHYDHSASEENAIELVNQIKEADAILAIGAGKLIDTGKMVADKLNAKLVVLPTLVSNCAPYAPLSVIYDRNHKFLRYDMFKEANYLVLIDYQLLLQTPKDYLVAGIGDTLAKWVEIDGITSSIDSATYNATLLMGIASAKLCLDILNEDSVGALEALTKQEVNPSFIRVVDTIIAIAGCVGGFAHKYGRVSGAHAIHNALSIEASTHDILHGSKVAYGVLVQLAYLNKYKDIDELVKLYKEIGLPYSLKQLNIDLENKDLIKEISNIAANEKETFLLIDKEVTCDKIVLAINNLETYLSK